MSGFDRWVGKVAVVTGASAGIGADIAKQLVEKGLRVVGLARRKEVVEDLNKSLKKAPGKLYALKCDMSIEEDIVAAFRWIKTNLGAVHILINNAGIIQDTTLIDGDSDKWRKILDVNVLGLQIATREAMTSMKANKVDGHIIHINSDAGHRHVFFPKINMYTASKFAVTALTETLRHEINANKLRIKVTSVSPGVTKTEIGVNNGFAQEVSAGMPALNPDDITEAVIYALSTKPHVQIHEIMVLPLGGTFT